MKCTWVSFALMMVLTTLGCGSGGGSTSANNSNGPDGQSPSAPKPVPTHPTPAPPDMPEMGFELAPLTIVTTKNGVLTNGWIQADYAEGHEVSKKQWPTNGTLQISFLYLQKVSIQNERKETIQEISGGELEALRKKLQFTLTIYVDSSETTQPTLRSTVDVALWHYAPADQKFVSITSAFPDPSKILTSDDVEATLRKLREVATLTDEYQTELVQVAAKARSFDLPHAELLLKSVYYTLKDQDAIRAEIKNISQDPSVDFQEKSMRTSKLNQTLMNIVFTEIYTDKLLSLIFKKTNALTYEQGFELMQDWSIAGSKESFMALRALNSHETEEDLVRLIALGKVKESPEAVAMLCSDYFMTYTDHSFSSAVRVVKMADGVGDSLFAQFYLHFVKQISPDALMDLARELKSGHDEFIVYGLDYLTRFNQSDALTLAGAVQYRAKDQVIDAYFKKQTKVTTENLIILSKARYSGAGEFIVAGIDKLEVFAQTDALTLASEVEFRNKDQVIDAYLKKQTKVTADNLIILAKARYSGEGEFIVAGLTKLDVFGQPEALKLAGVVEFRNKDQVIDAYFQKLNTISADNLIILSKARYSGAGEFIVSSISKLVTFGQPEAMKLVEVVEYRNKDQVIDAFYQKLTSTTADNLVVLAKARYSGAGEFIVAGINKLAVFGQAEALKLADAVEYRNKDQVIDAYGTSTNDITSAQMGELIDARYSDAGGFVMKTLAKLKHLKVAEAVTIAGKLTYNDKDRFLLKALDQVEDLKVGNLKGYAAAGYAQQEAIMKKGLEKLGG